MRDLERLASPRSGPGVRQEWRSVDTFTSVQSSYPSDWGLPRIPLAAPGPAVTRMGAGGLLMKNSSVKQADHNHPQKVVKQSILLLHKSTVQEHEYSQIHSLTVLGMDHHYESLPSLINPGLSLGKTAPISAASQSQDVSDNPCGAQSWGNESLYKKFFSLPVLDSQESYPRASEI